MVIKHLREHPKSSYLFWGDAGTSKSHFAVALFEHALREHAEADWATLECPVVRVNVPALLEEWVRKSMNEAAPTPSYSLEMAQSFKRHDERPFVLFDELDKFKPSEYKLNKLFEIVNAIYDNHGQVVATSNTAPDVLVEQWGETYGSPILRRIGQLPEGQHIHFEAA